MKNYLLFFVSLLLSFSGFAQTGNIKGVVKDEAGLPVISSAVRIEGSTLQTLTDSTGAYEFSNVPFGQYVIVVGDKYYTANENVVVNQESIILNITARGLGMENINAGSADIPTLSLGEEDLKETASSNVSSVLNASRDAFTTASSYVFSFARFRVRGYDSENFPTLLNGAVLTDLSNNRSEYSAWSGLNDVTRTRESTIGLSPVNFAFGEIGGVSSIDSRASMQRKQLGISYASSNRAYDNRIVITYGSGLTPSGWAYSVSYSRRWAEEGFIPGTFYDGHSFFGSIEKMINTKHSLALTGFGAKTKYGRYSPVVQEMYDLAGTNYYNRNWGYQNGKKRNSSVADNFQPLVILTHNWTINEKTTLETAVSYQSGKSKASSIDWFNAKDPRPDYYRYLPSFDPSYGADPVSAFNDSVRLANLYTANPDLLQLNWDKIYQANQFSPYSNYILSNYVIDANRYGFNTTFNQELNDHMSISAGVSHQRHDINYYKEVEDLLGGNYYLNLNQFADQTILDDSSVIQNDLNNPNQQLQEGDKYGYDYVAHIYKTSLWGQAVFKYDRFDYFVAAQLTQSGFYRTGNFRNGVFRDESFGDSEKHNFTSPGGKAGLTYKINGRNYVYLNAGFISRAPLFENTYVSPRTRSIIVDNIQNEKISSVEGGYILRAPRLKARLTGYFTQFTDQTDTRTFYNEDFETFVNYTLTGIDKRHLGIEIAIDASLGKGFTATGVASIGQFYFSDRPKATVTQDNKDTLLLDGDIVYSKYLRVSNGPQNAYTFGLNYRSKNYWWVSANLNYFDGIYVDYNPVRRTVTSLEYVNEGTDHWNTILQQEKMDGQFTLDASAGWSWRINNKFKTLKTNSMVYFNIGVSNILDNQEIVVTGYEQGRFDARERDINTYPSKFAYAFGRTYFASVTFRFN